MKKLIFSFALVLIITSLNVNAQDADKIKGYWLTEEGKAQIYVYKAKNGSYYGKISWLRDPNEFGAPKKDKDNPDESLRERPLMDLLILRSIEYDAKKNEWNGGTIYNSKGGKTYDAYLWFEEGNNDVLQMKGHIPGIRFLGKESSWTREEKR
ncbi:MAG: DUF2147 domain-containing protein [Bacteroidales bacterium]|nr:DUF2147 domain-containing protein [Bacteroidales bacterium]